jgi:death-on-curing family protein
LGIVRVRDNLLGLGANVQLGHGIAVEVEAGASIESKIDIRAGDGLIPDAVDGEDFATLARTDETQSSAYADRIEIAAAYLFYLCRNHAFVDGNKRVALGSCLVFLRLNGIEPPPDDSQWEKLTLAVAASELDREQTTVRLRALMDSK